MASTQGCGWGENALGPTSFWSGGGLGVSKTNKLRTEASLSKLNTHQ